MRAGSRYQANSRTEIAAKLLTALEAFLKPATYAGVSPESKAEVVSALGAQGWVETLVSIIESLVAAKRRHPLLVPAVRLVTAPFALVPLTPDSPLVPPLVHTFLAVPALPSSVPLSSLTHMSSSLPLFGVLLPAAAANPALLSEGRLKDELGRTYFLANLGTFGITGGMLTRAGAAGMSSWMTVVGSVLSTLGEGWGVWAERSVSSAGAVAAAAAMDMEVDSDAEDAAPRAPTRALLPANVAKPLAQLASAQHVAVLASHATSSGSLPDFATFALSVLMAFRGSPKWEATLDALLEANRGRALVKLLWREGVRGKWGNTADQWTTFSQSESNRASTSLVHQLTCRPE